MDAAGTGPTWSDIATWYDELVSVGSGPHETAVACLLGLLRLLCVGFSALGVMGRVVRLSGEFVRQRIHHRTGDPRPRSSPIGHGLTGGWHVEAVGHLRARPAE
jgi:hypothetical protein